ncbi:hypothetical protein DSC45_23635 [Streptomyces sp. YIM 130001]|nr:hypothetical protein DSC45_23635 [Streptomyces sp. YIM 130001]
MPSANTPEGEASAQLSLSPPTSRATGCDEATEAEDHPLPAAVLVRTLGMDIAVAVTVEWRRAADVANRRPQVSRSEGQ